MIINNRYLYIGCDDKNIKEFDIEKKIMIKSTSKHTSNVVGIKPVKDKNGNVFIVSYGCDKNIYFQKNKEDILNAMNIKCYHCSNYFYYSKH